MLKAKATNEAYFQLLSMHLKYSLIVLKTIHSVSLNLLVTDFSSTHMLAAPCSLTGAIKNTSNCYNLALENSLYRELSSI